MTGKGEEASTEGDAEKPRSSGEISDKFSSVISVSTRAVKSSDSMDISASLPSASANLALAAVISRDLPSKIVILSAILAEIFSRFCIGK